MILKTLSNLKYKFNTIRYSFKEKLEFALNKDNLFAYDQEKYSNHKLSFAQEGEDMVLDRIFELKTNGFYVDVGAHHPQRFSNTYHFYLKGWHGINIDATPQSMIAFNKLRPNDINLEIAISNDQSQSLLTYYIFDEPALNTFDENLVEERLKNTSYKIINKVSISTKTLAEVLDEYLPENQDIDFLSVDVENFDYQVLQSNNWQKYRPKIILVECLQTKNIQQLTDNEINLFMEGKDYRLYAKTMNTVFFIRNQS